MPTQFTVILVEKRSLHSASGCDATSHVIITMILVVSATFGEALYMYDATRLSTTINEGFSPAVLHRLFEGLSQFYTA
eukprot:8105974-Pyramimonas_sp.AAC.2